MGGILCNKLYLYHRYLDICETINQIKGCRFSILGFHWMWIFWRFKIPLHKVLKSDPMKLVYEWSDHNNTGHVFLRQFPKRDDNNTTFWRQSLCISWLVRCNTVIMLSAIHWILYDWAAAAMMQLWLVAGLCLGCWQFAVTSSSHHH